MWSIYAVDKSQNTLFCVFNILRSIVQVLDYFAMALDGNIQEHNSDAAHQLLTMCTHSYFDLTHVSPVVFLYLLKECYVRGTIFLSSLNICQEHVYQGVVNSGAFAVLF